MVLQNSLCALARTWLVQVSKLSKAAGLVEEELDGVQNSLCALARTWLMQVSKLSKAAESAEAVLDALAKEDTEGGQGTQAVGVLAARVRELEGAQEGAFERMCADCLKFMDKHALCKRGTMYCPLSTPRRSPACKHAG